MLQRVFTADLDPGRLAAAQRRAADGSADRSAAWPGTAI